MKPIQILLAQSIDYAGLFPPAELGMTRAVANYAEYVIGDQAWALGRFILPASRLPEFEAAVPPGRSTHWKLSALVGGDLVADLNRVAGFNDRHAAGPGAATIDTIEAKPDSVGAIEEIMRRAPGGLQVYLELPIDRDPDKLISAIRRSGGRAKVRTGGVVTEAFPSPRDLARFIHRCVAAEVPFKATAGLHHALRAEYPLTYDGSSRKGVMFGFLNLFLGTALLRSGLDPEVASRIWEEDSPAAIVVDQRSITWEGHRLDLESLRQARESIVSFGSCSFTEPIGELQELHLLPSKVPRA